MREAHRARNPARVFPTLAPQKYPPKKSGKHSPPPRPSASPLRSPRQDSAARLFRSPTEVSAGGSGAAPAPYPAGGARSPGGVGAAAALGGDAAASWELQLRGGARASRAPAERRRAGRKRGNEREAHWREGEEGAVAEGLGRARDGAQLPRWGSGRAGGRSAPRRCSAAAPRRAQRRAPRRDGPSAAAAGAPAEPGHLVSPCPPPRAAAGQEVRGSAERRLHGAARPRVGCVRPAGTAAGLVRNVGMRREWKKVWIFRVCFCFSFFSPLFFFLNPKGNKRWSRTPVAPAHTSAAGGGKFSVRGAPLEASTAASQHTPRRPTEQENADKSPRRPKVFPSKADSSTGACGAGSLWLGVAPPG